MLEYKDPHIVYKTDLLHNEVFRNHTTGENHCKQKHVCKEVTSRHVELYKYITTKCR